MPPDPKVDDRALAFLPGEGERVCAPVGGYAGMHSGRVVKVGQGTVKIKFGEFDLEDVEISCIKPWSKAAVEVCLACFV